MATLIYNSLFCTIVTVLSYVIGVKVFHRFRKGWLNPLYSATVFILCLLFFSHISLKSYTSGAGVFSLLLGTATVSLAVPLYKQFHLIKKHLQIILGAVMSGTLTGVASVVILTKVFHLNQEIMASLIPKSVTAPIALSISQSTGGVPSLTILFMVLSAIFSLITGPLLLKYTKVNSKIAKGLALGTSAQAIGANRAFEWGELEGAMGSIAMIMSALILTLISPLMFYI
ncbi:LrgB family protein [Bacillota bacterium Lsc_1132]